MNEPTNQPVLRSRTAPATAAPPNQSQLDVELARAQAIAQAGDAIPPAYRSKPGAVLLVSEWARSRGVDLLTAMQTVTFLGGRPMIDATMQRALAADAGYTIEFVESTTELATVRFSKNDRELGTASFTIEEAKHAGLAGKDTWKKYAADMLAARATTRGMKRFAPEVVVGLVTPEEAEEILDAGDPVAMITGDGSGEALPPIEVEAFAEAGGGTSKEADPPASDHGPASVQLPEGSEHPEAPQLSIVEDAELTEAGEPTEEHAVVEEPENEAADHARDLYKNLAELHREEFKKWRAEQSLPARFDHMTQRELTAAIHKLSQLTAISG